MQYLSNYKPPHENREAHALLVISVALESTPLLVIPIRERTHRAILGEGFRFQSLILASLIQLDCELLGILNYAQLLLASKVGESR
jgi:hypothetical protein